MATRSYIGVQEDNGISAVYCHYDGYPEFVGKGLLNYTTLSDVQEHISHGDRSSLTGPFTRIAANRAVNPQFIVCPMTSLPQQTTVLPNITTSSETVSGTWAPSASTGNTTVPLPHSQISLENCNDAAD